MFKLLQDNRRSPGTSCSRVSAKGVIKVVFKKGFFLSFWFANHARIQGLESSNKGMSYVL